MSEQKRVIAVYVGRRITTKGALAHFWQFDHDNKERGYKKQIALARIGEPWWLTLQDNKLMLTESPEKIDMPLSEQTAEWVAKDSAHYQHHKDKQAERRFKEQASQFEEALRPLKSLIDATRNHEDRAALITRITHELWRR